MDGLPVTIRLIDPPMHEFLPSQTTLFEEVTDLRIKGNDPVLLKEKEKLLTAVENLHEANPMLGSARRPPGHPHPRTDPHAGARDLRSRLPVRQGGRSTCTPRS